MRPKPCQKTWPKLTEGCELQKDGSLILPSLLTSSALHACQYVLRWFLTFIFHVPLQGIRLSTFFARLALYIVFLWPAMICGLAYWAFAGRDILSVKYKERGGGSGAGITIEIMMCIAWKFGDLLSSYSKNYTPSVGEIHRQTKQNLLNR